MSRISIPSLQLLHIWLLFVGACSNSRATFRMALHPPHPIVAGVPVALSP